MGAVLRRYWTPAFQLADLPAPDCPPVRVTILADSVRLVEAGQDPVGRGEGCDFARITAASQIIDASQAWQDLVPAPQGSAS